MKTVIVSRNIDFLLSVFPIWVPFIYLFALLQFPQYEYLIFVFTMLVLGETHFGITWLLFADKNNIDWALQNKKYSFLYPILIILFILVGYFYISANTTLFLILLFNFYHVTRQSEGISKLYCYVKKQDMFFSKYIIYIFSIFFILYGLEKFIFRFDFVLTKISFFSILVVSILFFITWYFISFYKKNKDIFLLFSTFTGALMFSPFLFTDKMIHAFGMGVGMHYCQYVLFSYTIISRRKTIYKIFNNKYFLQLILILILFTYSLLMVFFANIDKSFSINTFSYLIIIPIIFQTLHFYADMFLWKFSFDHQKNNFLKYLFIKK